MADGLIGGAYIGNPNIARQGARARQLAQQRDVNTLPDPRTYAAVSGLMGTRPDQMGFSILHPDYQGIRDVANPAYALGLFGQAAPALAPLTKGLPVGASIKPINLNKALYKSDLTMEEMLKVRDIPTVDRVRQSIDLVGEKEFEKMVNAQYLKYKPTTPEQEAMLVESVTLDILGRAQRQPSLATATEQGLSQAIESQSNSRKFSDALNVPDMNKEYIQSSAESLAGQLRELGFKVDLQHSGSVMGPSSYLNVADPTTGRYLSQPFRLSNHSKGAYNSEKVIDLNSPDQFQKAIDFALKTRNQPVSASQKLIDERGLNTDEETLNYMTKVYKRAMSKDGSLSNSERKAVQFMDENGLTDIFQETSIPPVTIK